MDDIPVLLAQGKKIGIPELLDQQFLPHGNWQGTSIGWTTLIWLSQILSEGDHRLNQVEAWIELDLVAYINKNLFLFNKLTRP